MTVSVVDVAVVGGGAMGSAAAWQLARRGAETVLLERFGPGHTRGASHGSARIFRLSYPDRLHIDLAREARHGWRELEDASGADLLTVTGGLDHGPGPYLDELAAGLAAAGVASTWLALDEAAARWPGMRFDTRVLYHPDSGRIHADRAVAALQRSAQSHGAVVCHHAPVETVVVRGDDRVDVSTGAQTYQARRVVVCAGAWTAKLIGSLVDLPPLRVTEEQPAHFASALPPLSWPSFCHEPGPGRPTTAAAFGIGYGLATPDEGVKVGLHGVGPVVDPDERDLLPQPRQLAALRRYVEQWLPGLDSTSGAPISCTYTSTVDTRFVLDRVGPVVVGAGFAGHGFKFVPAVGRILADLALDRGLADPAFSLAR